MTPVQRLYSSPLIVGAVSHPAPPGLTNTSTHTVVTVNHRVRSVLVPSSRTAWFVLTLLPCSRMGCAWQTVVSGTTASRASVPLVTPPAPPVTVTTLHV